MTRGLLTDLQSRVLDAFFAVERDFFLSGGAALAGFHLQHRPTGDLDLFTTSKAAFERARHVLPEVAARCGARLDVVQEAPAFRRVLLSSATDAVVVDCVAESAVQTRPVKQQIDGVVVDPVEEIFANKLTTLVGRQEIRDLVDVMCLERRGLRAEAFLADALAKDGGCTPATLAWLLAGWRVDADVALPPGFLIDELRAFKADLTTRMEVASFPRG